MMRRLFTCADAARDGIFRAELRWGERQGRWCRAAHGVYAEGSAPLCDVDQARAEVLAARAVARALLAGVLHNLDNVRLSRHSSRLGKLDRDAVVIVEGVPCASELQTLIDLAAVLDNDQWEQALECVLRRRRVTISDIDARLPAMTASRTPGTARIRQVLDRRPRSAVPTGSLLETLMVQLARLIPGLSDPVRQLRIENRYGEFVAFVDLAWPELGIFIELDGQGHKGQPVYDASRETAVVATTGWLCGRFTWHEVVVVPAVARRRLADIAEQARARPFVA
jgi:hypothetical protein